MRALGLRAEPKLLHWAVVEGDADQPVMVGHDKAKPPVNANEPEALNWYRKRVEFLIDKYEIGVIGVRYQETHGRKGNVDSMCHRSRIEGVLVEAAFASRVAIVAGTLVQLSAHLETKSAKHYVDEGDLRGVDLSSLSIQRRESVLAAVAALASTKESEA